MKCLGKIKEKIMKNTLRSYRKKKRKRKMEKELVPSLYHASSTASFKKTEGVIEELSQGYGELSKEFKKVKKGIEIGEGVSRSLEKMKKRCKSELVKRAVQIMKTSHETGSNLSEALEETAGEISKSYEIKRRRKVASTVEKYTLLLAGGLIVPVIIGSLISVINSLEITSIASLGIGASEGVREAIKRNSIIGNQIYIAFYAIISSLFVAYTEDEIEKALIYVIIILPASIISFNVSKSINVLQLL